jgi:predicted dehydrogenase
MRIGVAGAGFGKTWARAAAWHPRTTLAALCDPRREPVDALSAELAAGAGTAGAAGPRYHATFEGLIGDPDVEAVLLFTPAPLHGEQAAAALRAGKHVLSAVPVATTLDGCRRLVRAAAGSGRAYVMADNWPYVPTIRRARELYDAGALGRIYYAEAEYIHDLRGLWRDAAGRPTWRRTLPPLLYPTHGTAPYLAMTRDRFVEVTAMGASGDEPTPAAATDAVEPAGVPWVETALLRAASGAAFRLTNAFRTTYAGISHFYSFHGTGGTFETGRHGRAASVALFHAEGSAVRGWVQEECTHGALPPYRLPVTGSHAAEAAFIFDDFVRAALDGERPAIDAFDAVDMTLPGICGHQSAVEGTPVSIPDPRAWV